jgi:hypothetical protein
MMAENQITAQNGLSIRPYGKIGILLTPPNTADLDYSLDGNPGGLDDSQEVDIITFALGVQFIKERENSFALGGEIGIQNLFSSVVRLTPTFPGGYNNDYDKEWELYLGPLVEFSSDDKPLFFQAGAGLHIVFWEYISDFLGQYSSEYYSNGGVGASFGLQGTVGTKLALSEKLSVPFAFRTDIMFRYGILLQASFLFSLDFH